MLGSSARPDFTSRVSEPAHDPRRQRSDGGDEPEGEVALEHRREGASGAGRRETSFPSIGVATEAKFSGLQGLENSQNGERISTFREPVSPAGGRSDRARTSTRVVGGLDPRSLIPSGGDTDRETFPPCKVLKTHETRSESRLDREPTTPASPRTSRSPASPSRPLEPTLQLVEVVDDHSVRMPASGWNPPGLECRVRSTRPMELVFLANIATSPRARADHVIVA
jgi:hypothetical protein